VYLLSQATQESEIGRIAVQGQPRQKKFVRLHFSIKKAGHGVYGKHKIESWSRLIWAKNKTLSPKQPEQKWLEVWLKK
jgi:hypothetical protein